GASGLWLRLYQPHRYGASPHVAACPLTPADVPVAAAAERIDDDGGEQNERGDDLLRIGVEADEVETVVDRADDEGAEDRGPGRPAPREQAGSAEDGRRDRVEQILGADQGRSRIRRHTGLDEPEQGGEHPGGHEHADAHPGDADAGPPGGLDLAADG